MPIFYHIVRGTKEINFNKNQTTFMSLKNSFWYNVEIRVGKDDFGGYIEYIIDIPSKRFTHSLNPKDNSKILKLDESNIKEFLKRFPNRMNVGKENFGGIDATRIRANGFNYHYHDELVLWNWKNVDVKLGNKINSKMKPPIKNVICDTGLVSLNPIEKNSELIDIYCVALGKKPLAALDYSSYGRDKLRRNKLENNKIIEFCNSRGVEYLSIKKKGGMYLKSIFFLSENFEKAEKLMYILWSSLSNFHFNGYESHIAIGLLLGYKKENIIYFNLRNFNHQTTMKDIKKVEQKIKTINNSDIIFDNVEHLYQIEFL